MQYDYDELYEQALKKLEASKQNFVVNDLINMTLPNSGEPTDFKIWEECVVESVKHHLSVMDRWSLMKHE